MNATLWRPIDAVHSVHTVLRARIGWSEERCVSPLPHAKHGGEGWVRGLRVS